MAPQPRDTEPLDDEDAELLLLRSQGRRARREIDLLLQMIARRRERVATRHRQPEEGTRDHDRDS